MGPYRLARQGCRTANVTFRAEERKILGQLKQLEVMTNAENTPGQICSSSP